MPFGRKKKKRLVISEFNFIKIFFAFSRTKKYISLSLKRIKGTPQALSLGLATGIAISFTPFIGLHALLAIFISWVIGGSMAAALIGSLFGNPWTFPFIWYFTFEIGQFINYGFLSYQEEFSFKIIKKEISTLLVILKNVIIFANILELEQRKKLSSYILKWLRNKIDTILQSLVDLKKVKGIGSETAKRIYKEFNKIV